MRKFLMMRWAGFALLTGACLQFNGCLAGAASYAANFNPCGTILNCDPVSYHIVRSGYEGPGADPDIDPFCTWWPFCGADVDPFAPAGAP